MKADAEDTMYAAIIATAVSFVKHLELPRLCIDAVQPLAGGGTAPTASGEALFIPSCISES